MRRLVGRGRATVAAGLLLTGLLAPSLVASAAPAGMLHEQEPNDTYLEADGPIPAAGYIASVNNAQDRDLFLLNLQPQRQVTLTMRRNCKTSAGFKLTRSDGEDAVNFGNWHSETNVKSWTTPVVAAEYVGEYHGSFAAGCDVSFVLTPADAVIEGPLPARAPRTLQLEPLDVVEDQPYTATFTGSGYSGDYLQVWTTSAGSTCSRLPSRGNGTPVPKGRFDIPVTMDARGLGTATLCAALRNPDDDLIPDVVLPTGFAIREPVPLAPTSKKIRMTTNRKASWSLACHLPVGERCVATVSLTGPGGRTVVQDARIAAGRSALLSFKVPRSWAAAAKTGKVKLRMTGTVKRPNGAQVTLRAAKLRLKRR